MKSEIHGGEGKRTTGFEPRRSSHSHQVSLSEEDVGIQS